LKLKYDEAHSNSAFNFNVRRYVKAHGFCLNCSRILKKPPPVTAAKPAGLTLVHVLAQPEPFLSLKPGKHPNTWDKKCPR
jgi:hypothetical protein